MLLFLERGRQRARWIETEAESLIQHLGPGAFNAADRMEREANDFSSARYWRSVRKAIARETKVEVYRLRVAPPEPRASARRAISGLDPCKGTPVTGQDIEPAAVLLKTGARYSEADLADAITAAMGHTGA